jgi:endonuclease/exonuclease/phosphatase family metal-dependent hydrolase
MSGGFDTYSATPTAPPRLPLLQKAIKEIDADIIGLIDTYQWDKIYTETDLKELFGYKHAYCINLNDERLKQLGHNNGITLLSDIEIKPTTIRLKTRDAIVAQVKDKGSSFNLVVAYLDDMSEDTRLEQIDTLHSLITGPMVLMGDLNTLNDGELVNTKVLFKEFTEENPEIGTKLVPIVSDMLRGDVIKRLKSWGLEDAGQKQPLPTMPTSLFPASVDGPFLRIDYCIHSPTISVSNLSTHYDDTFKQASDHFPISFTIS